MATSGPRPRRWACRSIRTIPCTPAPAPPQAATPAHDNTLDFDLGSLSFDEPPPATVVEPSLASSHAGNGMDFSSEAEPIAATALPAEEETFDLAVDMDFA